MDRQRALFIFMLMALIIWYPVQAGAADDSNSHHYTAARDQAYTLYHNSRYGYSIEYPAGFKKQPPPANNDGRTFISPDGKATLNIYGVFNVFNDTPESSYHKALKEVTDPKPYKTRGKNWYVISWVNGSTIIYTKTYVGKEALNTFIFAYPQSQSKHYTPIITHLEATFRPGPIDG